MKRIFSACLAAMLLLWAVPAAYSEDTAAYVVDSVGMELRLPSDWVVLTDHTEEGDPALEWLDMTAEEVNSYLSVRKIQLDAISPDFSQEITVGVLENAGSRNVWNLAEADEKLVKALRDAYLGSDAEDAKRSLDQNVPELSEQIDVADLQITKSGERNTPQARFLMFQGSVDTTEGASEIYQAITILNGKMVTLVIRPQGALAEEDVRLLDNIVDTAVFENVKEKPGSGAVSIANPFIIVSAGIVLIVVGWLIDRHRRNRNSNLDFTVPTWSVSGSLQQSPPSPPPPSPSAPVSGETSPEETPDVEEKK